MRHMRAILPSEIGEPHLEPAADIAARQKRSDDVQFALLLTYITLGWMTIEGAASLLLGWASKSLLLEAFTCGYLSIVLMVGLAATRILGWWWLDSVAALALIPFLIKEGRAAIRGDSCC